MRLYILDLGKMYVDESMLVDGIHSASFRNQDPVAQWVDIPVQAALVQTEQANILYDTGCNIREGLIAEGEDTHSPFEGDEDCLIENQLASLGLKPQDINYVVVSHLHCDHVGYLHLFTNAEVIVADRELTQAMRLYALRGFGGGPYKAADFDNFLAAKLKWRLIPEDVEEYSIVEGVTALSLGSGHTFALTGLLVDLSESEPFLFVADALYRSDNLGPPVRLPGLVYDSIGYVKSAERITKRAKTTAAKIIFGHDKVQFAGLKKAPEYYS